MKIRLNPPPDSTDVDRIRSYYRADIDTDVMEVTIEDAFIGPTFRTKDGEELLVIMRDGGFEVTYTAKIHTGFAPLKKEQVATIFLRNGEIYQKTPIKEN